MSRRPRFSYAHAVHHVTLRCNNREFLFTVPSFELFLNILQRAREKFPIALYNYCLMTNHVHLFLKVGRDDTLSKMMHWISTSFSRRFNKLRGRYGHLWEGRFRSTIVQESTFLWRCMAYLDLNPVRAKMVVTPLEYRWCGHRALRDEDAAELDLHPAYLASGATARARYRSYLKFLAEEAKRAPVSLATEYFVGAPGFVAKMEKRFGVADRGARLKREDLGIGARLTGPRHGGPPGSKCRAEP